MDGPDLMKVIPGSTVRLNAALGHLKVKVHSEEREIGALGLGQHALVIARIDAQKIAYVLLPSGAFGWSWLALLEAVD